MKKFLGLLVMFMIISSNCLAMTFSQPVEIGSVGGTPQGGFSIKGASYNNGTSYKNGQLDKEWGKLYEKGIARFGNDVDALYVHYDCSPNKNIEYWDAYSPKFGDKDAKRTVSLMAGEGEYVTIYKIKNTGDVTLYLLRSQGSVAGTTIYVLLGRRSDGVFVKYFDMEDINIKYFGLQKNKYGTTKGMRNPWYKNCRCQGNTITIEYERSHGRTGYVKEGEFRFKWDEKAQWFGVEHVVY